jgi:acyl-CoA thioester hydrolase
MFNINHFEERMVSNSGKLVHTEEIQVRWYDMDAYGHVNNSVYFTYFELARIAWWRLITPPEISFLEIGPVIINAHCTFFKTITYPDWLTVNMFAGPAGRSSYECYYDIQSKEKSDVLYASGSTKVVWVDRQADRSIPLPDFIRRHLPEK